MSKRIQRKKCVHISGMSTVKQQIYEWVFWLWSGGLLSCPLASLPASAKALAKSRGFLMLRDDETDGLLFSSSLEGLS